MRDYQCVKEYEKLWGLTWDELVAREPELDRLLVHAVQDRHRQAGRLRRQAPGTPGPRDAQGIRRGLLEAAERRRQGPPGRLSGGRMPKRRGRAGSAMVLPALLSTRIFRFCLKNSLTIGSNLLYCYPAFTHITEADLLFCARRADRGQVSTHPLRPQRRGDSASCRCHPGFAGSASALNVPSCTNVAIVAKQSPPAEADPGTT